MASQSFTYRQSLVTKCLGNEGLILLNEIFQYLKDLQKIIGVSNNKNGEMRRLRHLETIFAEVNSGFWSENMISIMKNLIANLTIRAESNYILTSVEDCNAVASFLENLTPSEI